MVTTDLGACEWFVWDLRRSNLLDRGQLDQVVGEFLEKNPQAEPPALAEYLVSQGVLTQFQCERLLQGKTQGFVLGPFTLMDALGTGSMGTVYKAQSKTDSQWYAVKVLPRRSMWNVRIARRKVRAFEQCRHPAVVPFVDVGTSGGMHYLAWPLVQGETLDKVVARTGKLDPAQAAFFALQTAEGLGVCHQQSLFHGLLKPSNLMIEANRQVHILDFGIGSLLAETEDESLVDTMSTANSVSSGLDCASPESIMDPTNLNPVGDQYSLGCVLYYCLTGRYPFPNGTAAEKMMAHQFKQPTPIQELVPDLPAELVAVVERLMQKAPEARYVNTEEIVTALRPLAASGTPTSSGVLRLDGGRRPPSSKGRPPGPHAEDAITVAPAPRGAVAASGLPSRHSMGLPAAAATKEAPATPPVRPKPQSAIQPPRPAATNPPVASAPARQQSDSSWEPKSGRSWEERLGPMGIAISALVLCALAWLLTWKLF
jgi:serine/threonine-protein kinase